MKLQKILRHLQKLHPKEIDLSLDRIKNLCNKLGNPQNFIRCISVVGTNAKHSTIQAMRSILNDANIKCNIYTSPHIQKINERFVYDNKEISDHHLEKLLLEVEEVNNGEPITFFEILTAAYFHKARDYKENINIIESGLFHRFDATNILNKNLASVITSIGLDHLDWLPKNERTIEKIIYEKTSNLLNSNIIIAKQSSKRTLNIIKKNILNNKSSKKIFNEDYNYSINQNGTIYYKDECGSLKLSKPNVVGDFQIENISTAIATLRKLKLNINDQNIKRGIRKIKNIARFQEIRKGKIKNLCKSNKIYIDGSHNPLGAKVLNQYLETIKCNKHIILGMMSNKDHKKYLSYFKNVSSITTIDIPNQPNSIKGEDLKKKINKSHNVQFKKSIQEAINSCKLSKNDIILITGSLYLAGEVLNLN